MKIHCIQHVNFEGLGCIADWIENNGHSLTYTKLYDEVIFPKLDNIDFLIVMGGPMSTYDEAIVPWLKQEKLFIKKAIEENKIVLGICLGAQLIADVLGAKVYPNKTKEIGWFPVNFNSSFNTFLTNLQIQNLTVLHWHGDTFDIPQGALNHASSKATPNQLFIYNQRVVGIQFHLETTATTVALMLENCGEELKGEGAFIQTKEAILDGVNHIEQSNRLMIDILQQLTKQ